jgi:predicted nuclease of predicted toxin-antitoxin system
MKFIAKRMSEIFIELYLDEDVSVLIADLIRAQGFSVMTTHQAGNLGKSDAEQFDFATNQRKVLLTHNRIDFENLAKKYFDENKTHHGIIIAVRRLPNEMVQRILKILNNITADEIINQILYI